MLIDLRIRKELFFKYFPLVLIAFPDPAIKIVYALCVCQFYNLGVLNIHYWWFLEVHTEDIFYVFYRIDEYLISYQTGRIAERSLDCRSNCRGRCVGHTGCSGCRTLTLHGYDKLPTNPENKHLSVCKEFVTRLVSPLIQEFSEQCLA